MANRRRHSIIYVICGALLLTCAIPVSADPKPLSKEEQAKVDKAIDKGIAYLKRKQTKEGSWPPYLELRLGLLGQSILPAYALLEAGVSAKEPSIQKTADFIRSKIRSTNRTYDLSLALLFFDRLPSSGRK